MKSNWYVVLIPISHESLNCLQREIMQHVHVFGEPVQSLIEVRILGQVYLLKVLYNTSMQKIQSSLQLLTGF